MVGNVKHIIVVESLNEQDGVNFTGEALYRDYIKRRIEFFNRDFTHKFFKTHNKHEFCEVLNYIKVNAPYMLEGVVVHLEMHGDADLKGLFLANGELLAWEELSDKFRPINILTRNRLFVTMGTCYGRFLYKGVDPYKKSPYSGYISARTAVDVRDIYEKFGLLFSELIDKGNIVEAYLIMEESGSDFFYKDSERIFDEAFKATWSQLQNDPKFREDMLNEGLRHVEETTGAKLSSIDAEVILRMVQSDIYLQQKKAFDFTDSGLASE